MVVLGGFLSFYHPKLSCCSVSVTCCRCPVRAGERHRAVGVLQEEEEAQTSRFDDSQPGRLRLWLQPAGVALFHHRKVNIAICQSEAGWDFFFLR